MHYQTAKLNRGEMGSIHQRNAPSLSPELWAKVFAHLEQQRDLTPPYDASKQKRNQMEVHQLKLVCKHFRSIFDSQTELVQQLYVDADFSLAQIPSLLAWLHQNKGSVRVLLSECTSPVVDIIMAGLSPAPNINTIDIFGASACTVLLAGTYRRLEKCNLFCVAAEPMSLAPLAALPRLRQLKLQGSFQELHHLTCLTNLQYVSGRILGAQEFPPALQYLALTGSDLVGMHAQTLPACTGLTYLMLGNASLNGNNGYVYMNRNLSVVPTNIGLLTQLQTLHLSTGGVEVEPAELKWVSELTSLHNLSMHFDHGPDDILQHVLLLTKLTYLEVSGVDAMVDVCPLQVDLEWHKLQALCKLFIDMKRLRLGKDVLGLLQLPKLQEVSFADSTVSSLEDTYWFAALIYRLARLRPQVTVELGYGDLGG